MLDTEVFEPIDIFPAISGGTLVTWQLRPGIVLKSPVNFYLDWAEHETGDWIEVAGPTTSFYAVDLTKRRYSLELETAYRVRVIDGDEEEYISFPKQEYNNLNRHDYLIMRDIIRKETLRSEKYTAELGWLLRRKIHGDRCITCRDWDTGDVTIPKCEVCFGTGIVGGYNNAIPLDITINPDKRDKKLGELGETATNVRSGRMLGFPMASRDDIWISQGSQRRYYIHSTQNVSEMRGVPFITNVELRLCPPNDRAYLVPLSQTASSSSI